MRRLLLILAVLLFPVSLKSQDLKLRDCILEAVANFPLSPNKDLAIQVSEMKKSIIRLAWRPTLDLNGQATWQSDVVTLDLDMPFPVEFPEIPRDQYKVTTDITQMIYDGGSARSLQDFEDINASLTVQELKIKEFELRQVVEDLFFAILVTERKIEVVQVMAESLDQAVSQVESGIRNGLLSDSDLPVILAEQIKIEQLLINLTAMKRRAISSLGILMGREVDQATHFLIPEAVNEFSASGERPELKLFVLQSKMLDARKSQLNTQLRPKIMAFGQAGYGKPGLNFMGDTWDPFLLLGLKGTWNIWDWGKINRQKETFQINQQVIGNQLAAFKQQLSLGEQKQQLVIDEISSLLKKDADLLRNRELITSAYRSRLNNGLITTSQYLNEWTREQEARINQEVRKIELISSEYKLLSIQGKF
jgi:outer membrane protein TolC